MKIGLVRHFRVHKGLPSTGWLTPEELQVWFQEYDTSTVEDGDTDLKGIHWHRCYASDMSRAITTASKIYAGPVVQLKELREVQMPDFKQLSPFRLPFLLWAMIARISWLFSHKCYAENRSDVEKRVNAVLDRVMASGDGNVLIVSHAAFMMHLRQELVRRGFKGPRLGTPKNGKLYVFEAVR
ncbi:histidine phosphatase family protein [Paenibacillus sp. YYML68]|uniref:histidine phosphatase family protein n=1 Tax=Paenibacillus sp. YYML68 TaxID=2909250 RepID=UPI0024934020|nr:histidine phosphatase family protein [Paenibacillus sp. YYML68]